MYVQQFSHGFQEMQQMRIHGSNRMQQQCRPDVLNVTCHRIKSAQVIELMRDFNQAS
jgi:hypothetical protein